MGIGFQLLADFSKPFESPDALLSTMEEWLRGLCSDLLPEFRTGMVDTSPTLFCNLHPAAEELEISIPGNAKHLTATCKTSTVGPGFHIYLCDLLLKLGEWFGLAWREDQEDYFDEAGYFFSGNTQAVFDEMSGWLRSVCQSFYDGSLNDATIP